MGLCCELLPHCSHGFRLDRVLLPPTGFEDLSPSGLLIFSQDVVEHKQAHLLYNSYVILISHLIDICSDGVGHLTTTPGTDLWFGLGGLSRFEIEPNWGGVQGLPHGGWLHKVVKN